jgi:dGTPase
MKHSSTYDRPETTGGWPEHPSLEGQIADIADRIAYNCHDLEDGLRSRLIDEKQLQDLALYQQACEQVPMEKITDYVIRRTRLAKTMVDILASDAIETSKSTLAAANIRTLEQVLNHPTNLICFSPSADAHLKQLEAFLMQNMYLNEALKDTADKVRHWLSTLFGSLCEQPDRMPHYYQKLIETQGLPRTVCDYISGMTDRYCLQQIEAIRS